jgi:hypothetical protein
MVHNQEREEDSTFVGPPAVALLGAAGSARTVTQELQQNLQPMSGNSLEVVDFVP